MANHCHGDEAERKLLARNIKYFITISNIKASDLSAKIGVTDHQIRNYKAGRSEPSAITLHALCEALNVSMYRMFHTEIEWRNRGER